MKNRDMQALKKRKEELFKELANIRSLEELEEQKQNTEDAKIRAQKAKEGNAKIAEKLAEIVLLLQQCEEIADTCGVAFSSPMSDHYGMGGTYRPVQEVDQTTGEVFENSDGRWISSSENC